MSLLILNTSDEALTRLPLLENGVKQTFRVYNDGSTGGYVKIFAAPYDGKPIASARIEEGVDIARYGWLYIKKAEDPDYAQCPFPASFADVFEDMACFTDWIAVSNSQDYDVMIVFPEDTGDTSGITNFEIRISTVQV